MKHKLSVVWFTLMTVIMWSCQVTNVVATGRNTPQVKSDIQHMKEVSFDSGGITITETWYDSVSKNTRIDSFNYLLGRNEVMNVSRKIVTNQGKHKYEMYNQKGVMKEKSEVLLNPDNGYAPYQTLFEYVSSQYKTGEWVSMGQVDLNGTMVEKIKRVIKIKGPAEERIAYLDLKTGLPIKQEFCDEGCKNVFLTKLFVFDEIYDPAGVVFTVPKNK
ncbi:hypothetical protein [Brevibacillus panacihumi]|uniref:hypothetical protein n=1 Tax=Brevibacillus panacihumi TaxID=497735 RepID=UPI003D20D57B